MDEEYLEIDNNAQAVVVTVPIVIQPTLIVHCPECPANPEPPRPCPPPCDLSEVLADLREILEWIRQPRHFISRPRGGKQVGGSVTSTFAAATAQLGGKRGGLSATDYFAAAPAQLGGKRGGLSATDYFAAAPAQLGGKRGGLSATDSYVTIPYWSILNNSGSYTSMGDVAALQLIVDVSISAWIKIGTGSLLTTIAGKYDTVTDLTGYWVGVTTANKITVSFGGSVRTDGTVLSVGTLYHVVVTYHKGGNWQVYIDGTRTSIGALGGAIVDAARSFLVGATTASGVILENFQGNIDAVRVYSSVLTGANITELYGAGVGLATAGGASGSLVGWWKFDEGSGTTAIDSSSSANNGTMTGSPTYQAAAILG
jgi:hypothetical protein